MSYLFILGAGDPEMAAIEKICKEGGFKVIHAHALKRRVHPGNAYQADSIDFSNYSGLTPVWVECRSNSYQDGHIVIDHHREGDPGFGLPPEKYWEGSSIGQLCLLIGHERSDELSIIAAADHCLSHAYKSKCPGVKPEMLRKWRAKSRAAFQRIPVEQLEADVILAVAELENQPRIFIGKQEFVDARGIKLKEFAEAAAIIGDSIIYEIFDPKSRRNKVGVLGGDAEKINVWMDWAKSFLVDCYGDPQRGYAGGYCA